MLVVDVPERHLVEHALHIGQLEQQHGFGSIADRLPDGSHELGHVGDVFERVAADHDVGVEVRIALVVEIGDPLDVGSCRIVDPLGVHTGVDADAVTGSGLCHLDQELTFAAADLEHGAVVQVVVTDPSLGELLGEHHESGREALRLLVALRVLGLPGREGRVGHEAARRARWRSPARRARTPSASAGSSSSRQLLVGTLPSSKNTASVELAARGARRDRSGRSAVRPPAGDWCDGPSDQLRVGDGDDEATAERRVLGLLRHDLGRRSSRRAAAARRAGPRRARRDRRSAGGCRA